MKSAAYLFLVILSSLLISCNEAGDTVVGSTHDTQIINLSFNVDTTYLEASKNRLVAKGRVTNNGNAQVTSPWYVEGQFYTDATYKTKLGGSSTQSVSPYREGSRHSGQFIMLLQM